jgi:hypothetical protein
MKFFLIFIAAESYLYKMRLWRNYGNIVLTLFMAAATFASAPDESSIKKCDSPLEVDEKFS